MGAKGRETVEAPVRIMCGHAIAELCCGVTGPSNPPRSLTAIELKAIRTAEDYFNRLWQRRAGATFSLDTSGDAIGALLKTFLCFDASDVSHSLEESGGPGCASFMLPFVYADVAQERG